MNVDIPRVSIFIKTWKQDLCWLKYCLQFLDKNWQEPDTEIVIAADEDCFEEISGWVDESGLPIPKNARAIYQKPWPDGYSHAMYMKSCADRWVLAPLVLLLDSDSMLLKPASLRAFMTQAGRPIIPWCSYFEHFKIHPMSPWQRVTEEVTKMRSWMHFMPMMPILYYTDSLGAARRFVSAQHNGRSYESITFSDVPFDPKQFLTHPITIVDYDVIGFYCSLAEPERYAFRHITELAPGPFHQFHSWTMWGEDTEAKLKEALAQ
jgi:hypothetical protein